MRSFVLSLAFVTAFIFAPGLAGTSAQDKFPPPPKVPSDRVLIIPASDVTVAQARKPGFGTTLFDGGTFAASGLKRNDAEEGPVKHAFLTEVYVIQSGSGTYTSGGTLVGPFTQRAGLDAVFGSRIEGGVSHEVKAGDLVVIPPGVPHQFTKVDSPVAYINVKFQAKK